MQLILPSCGCVLLGVACTQQVAKPSDTVATMKLRLEDINKVPADRIRIFASDKVWDSGSWLWPACTVQHYMLHDIDAPSPPRPRTCLACAADKGV